MNASGGHPNKTRLPTLVRPLVFVLILGVAGVAGCNKESTEQVAEESPDEASPEGEKQPTTTAPDGPESEGPPGPEAAFVEEVARLTVLLEAGDSPADVLEALEKHIESERDRIETRVEAINSKRASLQGEALESFEDELSARPEVSAFFDAMERFQARATTVEMDRLDQLFGEILPNE